jgi:hypothetical protein
VLTSTSDNLKALAAVVGMMDSVALSEGVDVKIVRLERADADGTSRRRCRRSFRRDRDWPRGRRAGRAGRLRQSARESASMSLSMRATTL